MSSQGQKQEQRYQETALCLSPETVEKICLEMRPRGSADLRNKFANPTPLSLIGFLLSMTPTSCVLLGWGKTTILNGLAGPMFACGGLLMILGGFMEFFLGNTFPFMVFTSFGGFWMAFSLMFVPATSGLAAFGDDLSPYYGSIGFYLVFWALLVFLFLIASTKTNVAFFLTFLAADTAFCCLSASYFMTSHGHVTMAGNLQKAGGASALITSICAWYILATQIFQSVGLPFNLPVGDLSCCWDKGAACKNQA
ncbi:Protein alcS [Neolecta irregularis DAH-3]|uniref:Protein alcS n=1 Tax=Neolecta irregularis (strain DAH-3) TaxID=1198029 RepID=A0A1U7LK65_NEOID|nr:Protein alcS [Neolecta irregularis DAH-3]|eukprot:OLL23056.1 Protein alcS [Neolecta irregularis DAH-3]